MSTEEAAEFEYSGPIFTKVPDWIIFHPEATNDARCLYLALRSTIHEKAAHRTPRGLTLAEMAQLLPPVRAIQGKDKGRLVTVDIKKVRAALHCLLQVEALTETRRASHHSPARYRINDKPPADYGGTLSGFDRLNQILAGGEVWNSLESDLPDRVPQRSGLPDRGPQATRSGTPKTRSGTPNTQKPRSNRGNSVLKKEPLKNPLQEGSGRAHEGTSGSRMNGFEEEEPKTTNGNEGDAFVAGLKGVEKIGLRKGQELVALVEAALASGWTVKALTNRNPWTGKATPETPFAAHRDWLSDLGPAPAAAPKVAVFPCPDHPGKPYTHEAKCEVDHEPEAWEWRQAQRAAARTP